MWVLEDTRSNTKYLLPCNKLISIGRKDVDIAISGDTSVSRKHATLQILYQSSDVSKPNGTGKVILTDSSKFGTHVTRGQNYKVRADKSMDLNCGDLVEFGVQGSIFKLSNQNFNVAISMLEENLKSELQEALLLIGGSLLCGWHDDVNYLVVNKLRLSLKVVRALVKPAAIVTPEFVFKVKDQMKHFSTIQIEPKKYLPMVDEPNLSVKNCSFALNMGRKRVFQGKRFMFFTKKQHKHMGPVVACGGGEVDVADETITEDVTADMQTCFVNIKRGTEENLLVSSIKFEKLRDTLFSLERRMIDEYEIGLAILYCDSLVYCNPSFDLNSQNAFTQQTQLESIPVDCSSSLPHNLDTNHAETKEKSTKLRSLNTVDMRNPSEIETFDDAENTVGRLVENTVISKDECRKGPELGPVTATMEHSESLNIASVTNNHVQETEMTECYDVQVSSKETEQKISSRDLQSSVDAQMESEVLMSSSRISCIIEKSMLRPKNKRFLECSVSWGTGVNNFKKFRKVWPTYISAHTQTPHVEASHRVPKIIGGNDFYINGAVEDIDFLSQHQYVDDREDSNPFFNS